MILLIFPVQNILATRNARSYEIIIPMNSRIFEDLDMRDLDNYEASFSHDKI